MEPLKHECGIVQIRLRKPLEFYQQKYGTWQYGLNKLYLMMEKQHNRGQEGAGISCVKLACNPGEEYMFREKALGSGAITEVFANVHQYFKDYSPEKVSDAAYAKKNLPFAGELYMGHLRYSTTGKSGLSFVHPFLRRNNWRAKNLCLCGNFNMTNVDEFFGEIAKTGQHPRIYSDTYIMLEQVGHRLDRESERLFEEAENMGLEGYDITDYIEEHIKMENVLDKSAPLWDGGYVVCGQTGSGEMFAMRDPWGIRPAFWYMDDEILAVASERPAIQTTLDVEAEQVHELEPGQAVICSKYGDVRFSQIIVPKENQRCSFERIYFSRGSDKDIYIERKALGRQLLNPILNAIKGDVEHTVFSFIPNTAEVAFYGMLDGFKAYLHEQKIEKLLALDHKPSETELRAIIDPQVRSEKVVLKDIKLRTFITESDSRNDLAAHVYDITYGSLVPQVDNLVVIDDSIVRGTTLRESIIRILDRLHPKKIVIVSSSPQVRYPDYYGIDMSKMEEFIAFRAAIELLKDKNKEQIIYRVYQKCKAQVNLPKEQMKNHVKEIYAPFTDEDISHKMAEMLRAPGVTSDIEIVYQSLDGLHRACPNHPGDWYFSGDYPTPGGVRLVNQAFINYVERYYFTEPGRLNFKD
ncbi:MAG: amidophosphoribosyltransferase [Bacteroidaceae bacterium]|nr:amidophosphoribosyltransferase [Bacteroidaceae bacterium]MBR0117267.1 amidophosphoribosyltransferase [Prevotella sp.]